MGTPVNFFVHDKAFLDQRTAFQSVLGSGGIAHMNQTGFSFFVNGESFVDARSPSSRAVDWTAVYPAEILVDNSYYASFVSALSAAPQNIRNSIFSIIDRVFFNSSNTASMETFLSTDSVASLSYVAKSLVLSTTEVTGSYYPSTANAAAVPYSCAPYAQLSVLIPSGTSNIQFDLTIYVDNATWISDYPETTIIAVAPPIDYTTLLTSPLATATQNMFVTASNTANLNYSSLQAAIGSQPPSGYVDYQVKVYDTDGTVVLAPFNMAYKGAVPSQLQIRAAVKNAVLNSGVGTQTLWKARIPDLFVNTRYYLIPLWDQTDTENDQTIFDGIYNLSTVIAKAQKILPAMDSTVLSAACEIFEVAYNKMFLVSVADIDAVNEYISLLSIFPTYQSYTPTSGNANYQYMAADAQTWSATINQILAIAAGAQSSTTMVPTTDKGLTYYSFTQNSTEFCVITPDSYAQMQGATT